MSLTNAQAARKVEKALSAIRDLDDLAPGNTVLWAERENIGHMRDGLAHIAELLEAKQEAYRQYVVNQAFGPNPSV